MNGFDPYDPAIYPVPLNTLTRDQLRQTPPERLVAMLGMYGSLSKAVPASSVPRNSDTDAAATLVACQASTPVRNPFGDKVRVADIDPAAIIEQRVSRCFAGKWNDGTVISYCRPRFHVHYDCGKSENVPRWLIARYLRAAAAANTTSYSLAATVASSAGGAGIANAAAAPAVSTSTAAPSAGYVLVADINPATIIGRRVLKRFEDGMYAGSVVSYARHALTRLLRGRLLA